MAGRDGKPPWVAFPQKKVEKDGETKYFDHVTMSQDEQEHIRRTVIYQLRRRGDLKDQTQNQGKQRDEDFWANENDCNNSNTNSDYDRPF